MADIEAPPRPLWCTEEDGSELEHSSEDSKSSGSSRKKGRDRQNDVCLIFTYNINH